MQLIEQQLNVLLPVPSSIPEPCVSHGRREHRGVSSLSLLSLLSCFLPTYRDPKAREQFSLERDVLISNTSYRQPRTCEGPIRDLDLLARSLTLLEPSHLVISK